MAYDWLSSVKCDATKCIFSSLSLIQVEFSTHASNTIEGLPGSKRYIVEYVERPSLGLPFQRDPVLGGPVLGDSIHGT